MATILLRGATESTAPEPGSIALLGLGLMSLAGLRRRKSQ
jgi:hypothetical protein